MNILFEWVGTLLLLGILLVIVPIFFMFIITLEFRLTDANSQAPRRAGETGTHTPHHETTPPLPPIGDHTPE